MNEKSMAFFHHCLAVLHQVNNQASYVEDVLITEKSCIFQTTYKDQYLLQSIDYHDDYEVTTCINGLACVFTITPRTEG